MLLPLAAIAQTPDPHYDIPPAVPPPSCALPIARLDSTTGPPAYQRLAYQIKALQSAQEGVSALEAGTAALKKEQSPALGMSALFTSTKQAHDALLCAASIIAKYTPILEVTPARLRLPGAFLGYRFLP